MTSGTKPGSYIMPGKNLNNSLMKENEKLTRKRLVKEAMEARKKQALDLFKPIPLEAVEVFADLSIHYKILLRGNMGVFHGYPYSSWNYLYRKFDRHRYRKELANVLPFLEHIRLNKTSAATRIWMYGFPGYYTTHGPSDHEVRAGRAKASQQKRVWTEPVAGPYGFGGIPGAKAPTKRKSKTKIKTNEKALHHSVTEA
jgi:hypothetical protein